jgi:predicted O-methyltransferase YrrM
MLSGYKEGNMVKTKSIVMRVIGFLITPLVMLFAPIFYYVARTGTGIDICRKMGFQPLLIHYYQPIPDYENTPATFFSNPKDFPGFKIDSELVRAQLELLSPYANECNWPENSSQPGEYFTENPQFGYSSAILLYCAIRANGSKHVVEIGSGFSSIISFEALCKNSGADHKKLTCIEPYPSAWLKKFVSSHSENVQLLQKKAQEVEQNIYLDLEPGDILFIDSSHVSKLNSDVNYLYLEVLPRLKAGVIVHIHDVYIPYEYPLIHFQGKVKYFWNEQYLLEAFLTDNPSFEIILPGYNIQKNLGDLFQKAFPGFKPQHQRFTSSFWIKKIKD